MRKRVNETLQTHFCRTASIALLLLLLFTAIIPSVPGPVKDAGKVQAARIPLPQEYRAFWFSYYDFDTFRYNNPNTSISFQNYFTKVVKKGKSLGMNTIIAHVRPYSDALYQSAYYPWSNRISGKMGKSPGYDPLRIMVDVAHANGLRIEAWINPYRITTGSTSISSLPKNHPARVWRNTKGKTRNVLSYRGNLYYNPARQSVRTLIVNGAVEIVKNYNVDGIHMDDYFYPSFAGYNVKYAFDATEYNKSAEKRNGKSIAVFRRNQVNTLVKRLYKAIKAVDPTASFGISPAGEPTELSSKYAHYVDYKKWMRSSGYIDYICPQIYWGFHNSYAPFGKITDQWVRTPRNNNVKLYLGIAVYKSGHYIGSNSMEVKEWTKDTNLLKKQIIYGRQRNVNGFAFFDYADLVGSASKKYVKNLKKELKK